MSRPKLTGLGSSAVYEPPVFYCACGCGQYASRGFFGRWYVREHVPPELLAPPAPFATPSPQEVKRAQPADLFAVGGLQAPTIPSRPTRRGSR